MEFAEQREHFRKTCVCVCVLLFSCQEQSYIDEYVKIAWEKNKEISRYKNILIHNINVSMQCIHMRIYLLYINLSINLYCLLQAKKKN